MKKYGRDIFPALWEIKMAEENGMDANAYCDALNAVKEYEEQMDKEGIVKIHEKATESYKREHIARGGKKEI